MSTKKPNPSRKSQFGTCPAPGERELTVYNQGFAVVQEERQLGLTKGTNQVQLDGMPSHYRPDSLLVLSVQGEGKLTLGPVAYRSANLNQDTVLTRSVGSQIKVFVRNGSLKESVITGTLLAYTDGKLFIVLSPSGKPWIGDANYDVELEKLPEGLSNSASLVMEIDASAAGFYCAKILYETDGMFWQASHKAIYDEGKGVLSRLESWVSVDNRSGTNFQESVLKLLAGNSMAMDGVYFVAEAASLPPSGGGRAKQANVRNASIESVGEQKLYSVPGKVSLAAGETKQIPLFSAAEVPAKRQYYLPYAAARSQSPGDAALVPVSIKLTVANDEASNLAKAIPAGEVRIYQSDSSGSPQLTGATQIDHVAVGESFDIEIGKSTDIKACRHLVSYQEDEPEPARPYRTGPGQTGEVEKPRYRTEVREVVLHNFKTECDVEVTVYDEFPAKHELAVDGGHKFEAKGATTHSAKLTVPAAEKVVLRYTLRYQIR